uniref:Uncharacterized protein n=1 Tax=Odontella aurita TaxID=265563 RepID=A0A7S4IVU6_9STRA
MPVSLSAETGADKHGFAAAVPVPEHGPSVLRTHAMSTTFDPMVERLASHPEEARVLGNLNETCLHWSCFHRGPARVILPIASSYPEACGIVGACGRSPLHIVCAGGGRGTVNALEETVDLVEQLAGHNPNMSTLVSVEDGETPISGLWGVYARQCEDVLGGVLTKLGVGDESDGQDSGFDEEFASTMKHILLERREERMEKVLKEEEEEEEKGDCVCCAAAPPAPQPQPRSMFPAWATELAQIEAGSGGGAAAAAPRKRDRSTRSVSPLRQDNSDKHVRIQLPDAGGPCQCPYKSNPDPVVMPPKFESAAEEMDENIRTLIVQVEKMLMLVHAADYVFASYPGALPKPLAAESPIGGHFIFHPPPGKTPKFNGKAYGPYWTDDDWDPIQGAVRVHERLGELGVPPTFFCLLVGLYLDMDTNAGGKTDSSALPSIDRGGEPLRAVLSSGSVPSSVIHLLLERAPSAAAAGHPRPLVNRPFSAGLAADLHPPYPLHVAISAGRSWSEGVSAVLDAHPAALGARDTATGLFPFMLAAASESGGRRGPLRMKLGKGKHMAPADNGGDAATAKEEEGRQLRVVDTVFKLLLECPVLVNKSM